MERRQTTSIVCLAIVFLGVRYAIARERSRHLDLQAIYRRIYEEKFNSPLPPVRLEFGNLHEKDLDGITYEFSDGSIVIVLDPSLTPEELDATMRHEMCHVATIDEKPDHGAQWKACMDRVTR